MHTKLLVFNACINNDHHDCGEQRFYQNITEKCICECHK